MVESLVTVLMIRDKMSEEEAQKQVRECRAELMQRLGSGEDIDDCCNICEEWFGLEPDYLWELINC